jgi:hypothetical protein
LQSPLLSQSAGFDRFKIGYVGGIINKKDQMSMKRLIFRAMRGKVSAYFFDVPDEESDNIVSFSDKMVFIMIYHQGEFVYRRL